MSKTHGLKNENLRRQHNGMGAVIAPRCCFLATHAAASRSMDPWIAAAEAKSLFQQGNTEEALKLLDALHSQGLHPPCDYTYVSLLHHCTAKKALSDGRLLHTHISTQSFKLSSTLTYTLFSMYGKCGGSLAETRAAFNNITRPNVVAWTFMINEYAKQGPPHEALSLYQQMIQEGGSPNNVTYLCVLRACSSHGVLRQGYVKHMEYETAFLLFGEMEQEGVDADSITYCNILKACAASKDIIHGRLIHSNILKLSLEVVANVGTAIVDIYCKCESLEDARRAFWQMDHPHLEAWNSLIGGCAQLGQAEEAFELFNAMKRRKLEPGKVTFLSVLKASAALAALEQGSAIHALIKCKGLESDLFVASNLVDMHAKCGNLKEAQALFDKMLSKSLVTWNTLIAGYALHGQAEDAFGLAGRMGREAMCMNHVTFVGLLFACSHAGLVEEGCECFDIMSEVYHLRALMDHYCCMVDIFGRAGRLEEAVCIIRRMPFEPSIVVWKALLGACRVCSDLDLAKHAAESLEQQDKGTFVLLSNIYAAGAAWEEDLEV